MGITAFYSFYKILLVFYFAIEDICQRYRCFYTVHPMLVDQSQRICHNQANIAREWNVCV